MSQPAQPPSDDNLADAVRLSLVSGVGPRLRKALLEAFDTPSAVLAAAPADLRRVPGIGAELTRRIAVAREEIDVQAELDLCAQHNISILADYDPAYPRSLAEIHDPPGILFVRGEILPPDAIATVGSRHATQYGLTQAERLAGSLARAGVTIVSGLARGIDAAAHRGALISARHAMEQGREVFAVPGRVDSRMSRGCHRLIRDGAKLVETPEDVLEELGPLVAPTQSADGEEMRHPAELLLNEPEQKILAAISSHPSTIDSVVVASGLPTPQVLSTISVLEMRRLVRRLGGNAIARI